MSAPGSSTGAKLRKAAQTYWRIVRAKDFDELAAKRWLRQVVDEFGWPAFRAAKEQSK